MIGGDRKHGVTRRAVGRGLLAPAAAVVLPAARSQSSNAPDSEAGDRLARDLRAVAAVELPRETEPACQFKA